MTDQHSFAYIETDIAAGLTLDAYRQHRARTPGRFERVRSTARSLLRPRATRRAR